MRRGCLIRSVGVLAPCLLCSVLGFFVGLPRLRDAVGDEFEHGVST